MNTDASEISIALTQNFVSSCNLPHVLKWLHECASPRGIAPDPRPRPRRPLPVSRKPLCLCERHASEVAVVVVTCRRRSQAQQA